MLLKQQCMLPVRTASLMKSAEDPSFRRTCSCNRFRMLIVPDPKSCFETNVFTLCVMIELREQASSSVYLLLMLTQVAWPHLWHVVERRLLIWLGCCCVASIPWTLDFQNPRPNARGNAGDADNRPWSLLTTLRQICMPCRSSAAISHPLRIIRIEEDPWPFISDLELAACHFCLSL